MNEGKVAHHILQISFAYALGRTEMKRAQERSREKRREKGDIYMYSHRETKVTSPLLVYISLD